MSDQITLSGGGTLNQIKEITMKQLQVPQTTDKNEVFKAVTAYLKDLNISVAGTDFNRPWGGFFVIDDSSTEAFITEFFPDYSYEEIANGLELTPKILVVEPGKRLSWQYHHRRAEIWSVVAGPVGVIASDTDEQGARETLQQGQIMEHGTEVRHRLIGLDTFGIVAEFWKHTDANYPSDESDIVRVQDDFTRT